MREEGRQGAWVSKGSCQMSTTGKASHLHTKQGVKTAQQKEHQICPTSKVAHLHNRRSDKFAHHAQCQLAPQAKYQFCTTGEVSNLHNKQTVRKVMGVGPEGRKQEGGEERLGMIGRVGSIGRIPAELVRRWPNRSLRGGMPLASQREREHM